MAGPTELILILMMSLGWAAEQDPTAPTAEEIHHYAAADAEYSLYMNTKAIVPSTIKRLEALTQKPLVRELMGEPMANQIPMQIQTIRQTAQEAVGFDPVSDIHWAALWVKINAEQEPGILVTVKGRWPADVMNHFQELTKGVKESINGYPVIKEPNGEAMIAKVSDTILLMGTTEMVTPRLSKTWTPTAPSPTAQNLLKDRPHLYLASRPSAESAALLKHIRGDELDFVRWLILEHTEFGTALHHDGARARWTGKDTKGMERAQLTMDAAVSLMKAIQHGADGLGKAVVAWLPENSSNPQLATLYTHRKALLDLFTEARADGEFSAKVGTEPKTHSVTFESKGGSLLGAWPVTVLPLAGYFAFAQRMDPAVHMKEATIEHSKEKVLQPAPSK